MDYIQYPSLARRTAKPLDFYASMRHAALGCGSDMGEVATLVKKVLIYEAVVDPKLRESFVEEIGDVCWFIVEGCTAIELNFSDVIFYPNHDYSYSAMSHIETDIGYWALKGLAAAGRFADLVANESGLKLMKTVIQADLAFLYTSVVQIAFRLGIPMEEVFEYNIVKLRRRYPDKYSDELALARLDKQN